MTTPVRRLRRRAFLSPARAPAGAAQGVTPEVYGQFVARYQSGRFVETARWVGSHVPVELRRAQRDFVELLPPPSEIEGFRGRLAAALMHAETVAHSGWNHAIRVLREPVDDLPRQWVPGLPDHLVEEAVAGWGEAGASDFRELLWREVVLSAARTRLARMDLLSASHILQEADPLRDPALAWQLAAVWSVRARYSREEELWGNARDLFREAASHRLVSRAVSSQSPRAVARAVGDPDDLNLRLALVALGEGEVGRAAGHLREVSEEPADLLRVPWLMLLGETRLAQEQLDPAIAGLRAAVDLAPNSRAVVAALVAALEGRGRWDEAAALATEHLAVRRGNPVRGDPVRGDPVRGDPVWADFLITWAETSEPSLDWLRKLVTI